MVTGGPDGATGVQELERKTSSGWVAVEFYELNSPGPGPGCDFILPRGQRVRGNKP